MRGSFSAHFASPSTCSAGVSPSDDGAAPVSRCWRARVDSSAVGSPPGVREVGVRLALMGGIGVAVGMGGSEFGVRARGGDGV